MSVKSAAWISRDIIISPIYMALCTTKEQFEKELRRLKIPVKNWPDFINNEWSDASTHTFLAEDSHRHCCIVCIRKRKDVTTSEVNGLLCHESVHVWQNIKDNIGEYNPSAEFEAYSIQNIFQNFLEAYNKLK